MELIDKATVVAEINRVLNSYDPNEITSGRYALVKIRDFLDTIETKEVDLEKIFNDEYSKFSNDIDAMDYAFPIDLPDYKDFAKHFFELGLKQKGG